MAVMSFSLAACKPKAPVPQPEPANTTATSSPASKPASAAPTNSDAPASQAQFDIEKVPVTTAVLPPFPYLEYPPGTQEGAMFTKKANFDSLYVVTGKQLRKVEGRFESHKFYLSDVKMSEVEARRNYENLIAQMGGIKVNEANPAELAQDSVDEIIANKNKTRYDDGSMSYDVYLVRKPDQLVWIVLMAGSSHVDTLVLAEQPFKQTIAFVTDPSPKLTIEGHTDNVGDPAHNKTLSQQRADAVMGSLIAAGIAKERLSTLGMGDTKPVADNKDEEGRARNRRVELVKRT